MKYIESNSTDVYFNLALEEYVFQNFPKDDCFMLWINDNSIVMGKYQNAFEEINIKEVEKIGIKVARRNSGGGTVFHDKGNLNYSIIKNYDKNLGSNYNDFIDPVINALNKLGVKAKQAGKSDIVINNKKISGSAQYSKRGRILHHGTLLYNSDLGLLEKMLETSKGLIESKSVKSIRSSVTNISDHIDKRIPIEEFKEKLLNVLFADNYDIINRVKIDKEQTQKIQDLARKKYMDWQWIYGKSPNFKFEKEARINNIDLKISLLVEKGIISEAHIEGVNCSSYEIASKIIRTRYGYKEIFNKLKVIESLNIESDVLVDCFF